jgi:hypothetical protein
VSPLYESKSHWILVLLCMRCERPRRDGTADERDEFPSPHGFARAEDYIGGITRISHFWLRTVPFVTPKRAAAMSALVKIL